MDQGSSLLLVINGLIVDRVVLDDVGRRVVHYNTDPALAGRCPQCRQQSSSAEEGDDPARRARITTRARRLVVESIGDQWRPVSSVAAVMCMDWRTA